MKKLKFVALMFFIAVVAVSCKKEEGPTGPQGPAGAQGATGTTNVIYSPWTGFDAANWHGPVTEFGKTMQIYYAAAPEVTQSIIDSGVVLVYFKSMGTQAPSQLPLVQYNLTQDFDQYLGYRLTPDTIQITFYNIGDNNDPSVFTGTSTTNAYRYVVIPGGVTASKKLTDGNVADFKKMKYQDMCRYFNIPE